MIKIEDLEFKGVGYITTDIKGTWVWEVKPILDQANQQWILPKEYRDKPNMSLLLNQVNGSVLPTLLNMSGHEFNDTFKVLEKPRIYKVILEEVEKCDTTQDTDLSHFQVHTTDKRMEMYEASQNLPGFPGGLVKDKSMEYGGETKDLICRPKK